MDKYGYFNFGIGNDYFIWIVRIVKKFIVEVNKYMLCVYGEGVVIYILEIDVIVENYVFLIELLICIVVVEDIVISQIIVFFVLDGVCFQMGVGVLLEFICNVFKEYNDLGVYIEVLNLGLVSLI